ncbi:LapA family protein [Indiicoccus explosivorum]|uniref:LapA family protein n=1 Tax=Indiicoccus explosivorum TaxID=1917864 RepID=UPI000B454CA9|nr:lipopolysaccharide assembly protein LapA domain-containing protein [Indiicoccus explosivorum]
MKTQWFLIIGLLFAVIIAVFAVNNVDSVPVNYVFGESEWPLILVILASALAGALLSGSIAMFRNYKLSRDVKKLRKEVAEKENIIAAQQNELGGDGTAEGPDPVVVKNEKNEM